MAYLEETLLHDATKLVCVFATFPEASHCINLESKLLFLCGVKKTFIVLISLNTALGKLTVLISLVLELPLKKLDPKTSNRPLPYFT